MTKIALKDGRQILSGSLHINTSWRTSCRTRLVICGTHPLVNGNCCSVLGSIILILLSQPARARARNWLSRTNGCRSVAILSQCYHLDGSSAKCASSPSALLLRMGLAPGAGLAPGFMAPIQRQLCYGPSLLNPCSTGKLVAQLSRHVNHTGSDVVSLSMGTPFSPKASNHVTLRADWWTWKILFTTRWKFPSHINYLEMKMILQSIRWRARTAAGCNARWLHLSDSMVCNYILSKGRTSSQLLQPITREIAAYLLALNSHQLQGHVDSSENPTDAASREATH